MLIKGRENILSQLGANMPSQPPGTLAARQGLLGWGGGSPEHPLPRAWGLQSAGEVGSGKTRGKSEGPCFTPSWCPIRS